MAEWKTIESKQAFYGISINLCDEVKYIGKDESPEDNDFFKCWEKSFKEVYKNYKEKADDF